MFYLQYLDLFGCIDPQAAWRHHVFSHFFIDWTKQEWTTQKIINKINQKKLKQTNITLKCCSLLFDMFQNVFWRRSIRLKFAGSATTMGIHGRWKWPLEHTGTPSSRYLTISCIMSNWPTSHVDNLRYDVYLPSIVQKLRILYLTAFYHILSHSDLWWQCECHRNSSNVHSKLIYWNILKHVLLIHGNPCYIDTTKKTCNTIWLYMISHAFKQNKRIQTQ